MVTSMVRDQYTVLCTYLVANMATHLWVNRICTVLQREDGMAASPDVLKVFTMFVKTFCNCPFRSSNGDWGRVLTSHKNWKITFYKVCGCFVRFQNLLRLCMDLGEAISELETYVCMEFGQPLTAHSLVNIQRNITKLIKRTHFQAVFLVIWRNVNNG